MNYTVLHSHTELSQAFTTLDSVNNYKQYVDKACELGMKAFAFTEHGNVMQWYSKKKYCEEKGIKYIHGVEAYVTESLKERIADNYHMVLLAKNKDGFREINKLCSIASMRDEKYVYKDYPAGNHFYRVPRITYDELKQTSDNIIILTACLGGILNNGGEELQVDFIDFMKKNKHRCFLEIQHHNVPDQVAYNKKLYKIHQHTGIELVATTDTHALNDEYLKGREVLQKSKNIHFANEDNWDLVFRSYVELVEAFEKQGALPKDVYLTALNNTNRIADMVEEFSLDLSFKYPKTHENPKEALWEKIKEGLEYRNETLDDTKRERIIREVETFDESDANDFILFDHEIKKFCIDNGIEFGEARGSVGGSYVAYLLGIHHVNPLKYDLLFERFMSKERVTLGDIDTDYSPEDIPKIKDYIYSRDDIMACEIITFNTIAYRGAVRDVARALELDRCTEDEKKTLSKEECERIKHERQALIDKICDAEEDESLQAKYRAEHPELFKYVDMLQGVVVSVGSHPAGTVVADRRLDEELGVFHSKDGLYPVSQLNMDEIEELNYLKLDILGLKNIGVINETCNLANIERIRDWNTDYFDSKVWDDIKADTIGVFQWERSMHTSYLKRLLSGETLDVYEKQTGVRNYLNLFVIGNAGIRPTGDSYREALADGEMVDYGHQALNEFLAETLSYVVYQEQIMQFVHEFCGFTLAESDVVRRAISAKDDSSEIVIQVEKGFIATMIEEYGLSESEAVELAKPFLQVIKDASGYGFNKSHSQAYSIIGYQTGYLRYYYPKEFGASYLNYFDDEAKASRMIGYLNKRGIGIKPPVFRYARGRYTPHPTEDYIFKGLGSIKHIPESLADEMYELRDVEYDNFLDALLDIKEKTSADKRAINILIKLGFFREFGGAKTLLKIHELSQWVGRKQVRKAKIGEIPFPANLIKKYAESETPKLFRGVDFAKVIGEYIKDMPDEDISFAELIDAQKEYMGYVDVSLGIDGRYCYVDELSGKYKNLNLTAISLYKGQSLRFKIDSAYASKIGLSEGDFVYVHRANKKPNWRPNGYHKNGKMKFEKTGTYSWHIANAEVVPESAIIKAKAEL